MGSDELRYCHGWSLWRLDDVRSHRQSIVYLVSSPSWPCILFQLASLAVEHHLYKR
jgi:hypothetical protein